MNGDISVKSQMENGSTFFFNFQINKEEESKTSKKNLNNLEKKDEGNQVKLMKFNFVENYSKY